MHIIDWEKKETTAIVRMNNGENRQNLAFATALNDTLDAVIDDTAVTAVILTSTDPKYWSLGVDVDWIGARFANKEFDDIKAFMYGMNSVFKKLLTCPVPAIAAINGHAFGNGAILSCACDFRLMRADRGFFCFPEVDLGIPFLPGMIQMLKKAIAPYKLNELMLTGKRIGAPELAQHHVIEKASTDADALMEDALLFAGQFMKKRGIFAEHKKRLYKKIIKAIDQKDPEYIDSLFLFVQE